MNGKFIVIEGIEGAGKTSIITKIADILYKYGIKDIIFTHEPGSTPLAEYLRTIIKSGINNEIIHHHTELLMIYAARIQLLENVIKPNLNKGTWVIGDRHDLSSRTYQGAGKNVNKELLKILRKVILGKFRPNLTFYLDIPPYIGLARSKYKNKLDRIESESIKFFNRVRDSYLDFLSKEKNIIMIDASKSLETTNSLINKELLKWLNNEK